MTTVLPTGPAVGEKDEIVGLGSATTKLVALRPAPLTFATRIGPVVAVVGTIVLIWVGEFTTKVAAVPLNVTELAPVNPVPVRVTLVPLVPVAGENEVIVGEPGGVTSNGVPLTAVPVFVTT